MALITCPDCGQRYYNIHSECTQCGSPFSEQKKQSPTSSSNLYDVATLAILMFVLLGVFYSGNALLTGSTSMIYDERMAYKKASLGKIRLALERCRTGSPRGASDPCLQLDSLTDQGYISEVPFPPKDHVWVHRYNSRGYHKVDVKKSSRAPEPSKDCDPNQSVCIEIYP